MLNDRYDYQLPQSQVAVILDTKS